MTPEPVVATTGRTPVGTLSGADAGGRGWPALDPASVTQTAP